LQIGSTPTVHSLPFRAADFSSLAAALDYAALGETGINFYSSRGFVSGLSYRRLREDALSLARKLLGLGLCPGDRVALIAETDPYFVKVFFACQYAGLIPVPLPASMKMGAHATFVTQLKNMLRTCDAHIAVASEGYKSFLQEASAGLALARICTLEELNELPDDLSLTLPSSAPDDIAYIQFTSGSTRFPKGVVVTQRGAMSNLVGIVQHGVKMVPGDRCMSWLPFYHDMGLVGFMLVPVASQTSVDYLPTHEFAMRPRQWLQLMSTTKATISFSPCFGYDLCARRLREGEVDKYDLSNWRVAGIGAEMIRPKSLDLFAEMVAPAGFDPKAFLPCYGMAECTLGVSFSTLGTGYTTDYVDLDRLWEEHRAVLLDRDSKATSARHFVNCGRPLPDYDVEIRDEEGNRLADYHSGVIYLRGPSVMAGYFNLPEETRETLSDDGWLDTGDIGYLADGCLTLTGRKKDLIIINGRNIWPQDLEHLCETQPEVRIGDVLAFSAPDENDLETCVVVVQCREADDAKRQDLVQRLTALLRQELSLDCIVELVPPRSLPVTSSGKLSRSRARLEYFARRSQVDLAAGEDSATVPGHYSAPSGELLSQYQGSR
jgi:fatty-acyl-CoA synthase